MTIRVLVNGAAGKMGKMAVNAISNEPNLTLVGELGRHDNLKEAIKETQAVVVLDLTNADVVFHNAKCIIEAGAHPVIGTTGLLQDQVAFLQHECAKQKLGGIIAPNFSLGAMLMMKCVKEIARYFSDVEIIEMHHAEKLDSPSGTAMRTAELIAAHRQKEPAVLKNGRESVEGARGALYQSIPIHAVRLQGFVAHQQVIFGGVGETLTIRHDSMDRLCFMPGILLACRKVVELNQLVYGLEQVME